MPKCESLWSSVWAAFVVADGICQMLGVNPPVSDREIFKREIRHDQEWTRFRNDNVDHIFRTAASLLISKQLIYYY